MRKRILSLVLVAVMLVSLFAAYPMTVSAETATPDLVINNYSDLQEFDAEVEGGNTYSGKLIELGDNITLSSDFNGVGAAGKHFAGTFDGKGYTVTASGHEVGDDLGAFFVSIDGATIKNVNFSGRVVMGSNYAATVVCSARGTCLLENVRVSTYMQSETGVNLNYVGGFVSLLASNTDADITFDGCVFDGTINFSNYANECGGFLGYTGLISDTNHKKVTFRNSVFAGTIMFNATEQSRYTGCFVGYVKGQLDAKVYVEDCYSIGKMTFTEGMSSFKNGVIIGEKDGSSHKILDVKNFYYVPFKNSNGTADEGILQSMGTESANIISYENVVATTLDAISELTADDFSADAKLSFKDNTETFNYYPCPTGLVPDNGTWIRSLRKSLVESDADLVIYDYSDLQAFDAEVEGGNTYSGKLIELGDNITLSSDFNGVGAAGKHFAGTFDGKGYTVTASGHEVGDDLGAFFVSIDGATIKNVNFSGRVVMGSNYAATVVCSARGTCLLENVRVSTYMQANNCNLSFVGGFVSLLASNTDADVTFDGCVFDGTMNFTNQASDCGAFLGYTGLINSGSKNVYITNSVYAGTMMFNDTSYSQYNACFVGYVKGTAKVNVNDCYSIGKLTFKEGTSSLKNGVIIGEKDGSNKILTVKNFYYVPFKNSNGTADEGILQSMGTESANIISYENVVATTLDAISELTADDFSADAKLSFKENLLHVYYPCPTGLATNGWVDSLMVASEGGARVLGAQLRYTDPADQYTGIRFVTVFDASKVEGAASADANFGVILISEEKYGALTDKTSIEALRASGVEVKATKATTEDGIVTVKAVVYGIEAENYADGIVAIAYIGDTVASTALTRSIYNVAVSCVEANKDSAEAIKFCEDIIAAVEAAN